MNEEIEQTQLDKLEIKIPYDEDIFGSNENYLIVLNDLLEDSKNILLETLYPFDDFEDYEIPKRYYNWQLRCCVELYNLADKQGITNYAENTISWTKLSDGLSNSLMNKLVSNVGTPKSRNVEDTSQDDTYNLVYNENEGV